MMMMMHSAFGGGATRLTRQMKEKNAGFTVPPKKKTPLILKTLAYTNYKHVGKQENKRNATR